MKAVIKGVLKLLGLEGSRTRQRVLSEVKRLDPDAVVSSSGIQSIGLDIRLPDDFWMVESYPILYPLFELGFRMERVEDKIRLSNSRATFTIQSQLEAGIVFDVYARGVYRLIAKEQFLLIDVGANLGIASIYAAQELGAKVEGFELVPGVAERARAHVSASNAGEAITIHSFGLGRSDAEIEVVFSEKLTGSTSIHLPTGAGSEAQRVRCEVKGVAKTLGPILEGSALPKFMKLDCEGAEYEILEALLESNLLGHFDGLLMEYHNLSNDRNRKWIEQFCAGNGFWVHSHTKPGFDNEMIYAFRKARE